MLSSKSKNEKPIFVSENNDNRNLAELKKSLAAKLGKKKRLSDV